MPSLKRDKLLSDLERERLLKRDDLDRHTRTTNEVRVKKKLSSWIKNTTFDVHIILENLPEDQIRGIIPDYAIYIIYDIAKILLNIKGYRPIEGEVNKPDDWKVVVNDKTKRPANNADIFRASILEQIINDLSSMRGEKNVISVVLALAKMSNDPYLQDKITDNERQAIERLAQAYDEFIKYR